MSVALGFNPGSALATRFNLQTSTASSHYVILLLPTRSKSAPANVHPHNSLQPPMASTLPSPEVLAAAAALNVYDDTGNEVSFGSLIKDQNTIVVFIRLYFFWRFSHLSQTLTRSSLPPSVYNYIPQATFGAVYVQHSITHTITLPNNPFLILSELPSTSCPPRVSQPQRLLPLPAQHSNMSSSSPRSAKMPWNRPIPASS